MAYSKVSMVKPKCIVVSQYCKFDLVERSKRKKVILEKLMNIKPTLNFFKANGSVDKDGWKSLKKK